MMHGSSEEDHPSAAPEVLIVGGGPVGVALACDLMMRGVVVRVVDAADEPAADDPHSRAILLVPHSLEWLAKLGVGDGLLARGRRLPAITYFSDGRRLGQARFDRLTHVDHRFLLALPQRETEAVLRHHLHGIGGRVERGPELVGLASAGPIEATVRHRDGRVEILRPRFLIGADGAASATRRLVGEELGGDPTDVTYLIADAPLDGVVGDHAQYHYSTRGLLAIIEMSNGLFRIAGDIPHPTSATEPTEQRDWQAALQMLVRERAAGRFVVGPPTYARTVRPRCGIAATFRIGDVLLAGDAAHVISPAGGQGLNLGFGDASALGWRIAAVLSGALPPEVLDDYARQRRAVAIRTAATAARLVRFARQPTALRAWMRDHAFVLAERAGLVDRYLTPLLSQLDVRERGRIGVSW